MKGFIPELLRRNRLLFYFGLLNFIAVIVCMGLSQSDQRMILGISAWIKPLKFFLSVGILSWTMGWLLRYLKFRKAANIYSIVLVLSMTIELSIISLQSARGERSHFNISDHLNASLFATLGIVIGIFTLWTAYICYLFFRQKEFDLPRMYVWGIRIGIILFIFFSLEGGIMVHYMRHTVGGLDGGPGLPLLNWSKLYGDLRVAHFFGIHSLQIIPLFSYYITKKKTELILFSILYFLMVMAFLLMALQRVPLV